jgi:hypothetical protein
LMSTDLLRRHDIANAGDDARVCLLAGRYALSSELVVTGSLSAVDVKNFPGHKACSIEIDHRIHDIRHVSHSAHRVKCPECRMCLGRMHGGFDDSW